MTKKIVNQPTSFPTPQVQIFGGASIYEYGLATSDTHTPTNHTFRCLPSPWPIPIGTCTWFGCALPDGDFASGSMTLKMNELDTTMNQTSLFVWDVTGKSLQCIPVPTTTGALNPPFLPGIIYVWSSTSSYNSGTVVLYESNFFQCISSNQNKVPTNTAYWAPVTSGAAIDTVRSTTIGGVNYIFAVGAYNYGNWPIAITEYQGSPVTPYGQPYTIMGFAETNGVWAFDPSHSYTAEQLYNSSSAGQSAFPPSTNQFGEQVWTANGPVPLIIGPQSGHLIFGTYYYQSGTYSGALIAVNPATGTVTAFYQIPNCTDINSVELSISVRDLTVNPTSSSGDERFIMTPDVFIRAGGGNYGHSGLMEFSYDATAGTFTPKSPPICPYTSPGLSYDYNYNLAQYDSQGNLWLPTHGGSGLAVFDSHEMHVYQASGGNIPTFENGGANANWNTTQFPTTLMPDYRFASYATTNGFDQSIDWDNTNNHMILTTLAGTCLAVTPDSTLTLGANLIDNPYFALNTNGWNGFFTSTNLTQVTNSAFILPGVNPTGTALQLTANGAGTNLAGTSKIAVIGNRNYSASAYFLASTGSRSCTVEIWWEDQYNNLVGTSSGPTVSDNTTTATYAELLAVAPANAAVAFVLLQITGGTASETHMVSNVYWQEQPATATNSVDLNKTRISDGASTQNNKGAIINGRLYTTLLTSETSATVPYSSAPQWLYSVDLSAFQ